MSGYTAQITIGEKKIEIINSIGGEKYNFDTMIEAVEILRQKTDEHLQTILDQNKTIPQTKEEEPEEAE
jgi:hypothetical protein